MRLGIRKAAAPVIALVLAGVAAGCGSDPETTSTAKAPPAISAATAKQLAELSDQVATELDAGDTCDAAYAADQLQGAVEDADLSAGLRPGVEQVASDLVNEVNCPPPPPEPEPKKKPKKPKEHGKQGGENGDEGGPGPPGHSGGLPPGQAKLKGEEG